MTPGRAASIHGSDFVEPPVPVREIQVAHALDFMRALLGSLVGRMDRLEQSRQLRLGRRCRLGNRDDEAAAGGPMRSTTGPDQSAGGLDSRQVPYFKQGWGQLWRRMVAWMVAWMDQPG